VFYVKAVILAGGFGKRLRPITDTIPKPLIEICGKPILVRQLEWLRSHGVEDVILCIGFLKEKIIEYLGNGKKFGVRVGYVVEDEPLGTGGAILNAEHLLRGDKHFLVLNGDVLTDLDPKPLINGVEGYLGALALVPLRSPYGIINTDESGVVTSFIEKPILYTHWINAGIYCLSSEIFPYLKEKSNIETATFPELAAKGLLKAVRYKDCFWRSIEVYKDIEEAERELSGKRADLP
jgi:NDP-sugar pyrophosphorylase family protein